MHSFYFVIEQDLRDLKRQSERVANICAAASRCGVSFHRENHGDAVTLHVEITDDQDAIAFKLSVEPALLYSSSQPSTPQPLNIENMSIEPRRDGPIHLRTAGFWSRLHEVDKPLSLKDVADNLKNYAIAAASYAGGVKLATLASGFTGLVGIALAGIACLFFITTLAQSWILTQKQAQDLVPFTTHDHIRYGLKSKAKIWLYALIPISFASAGLAAAIWFTKAMVNK